MRRAHGPGPARACPTAPSSWPRWPTPARPSASAPPARCRCTCAPGSRSTSWPGSGEHRPDLAEQYERSYRTAYLPAPQRKKLAARFRDGPRRRRPAQGPGPLPLRQGRPAHPARGRPRSPPPANSTSASDRRLRDSAAWRDLDRVRAEHLAEGLERDDLDPDPVVQCRAWWDRAVDVGVHQPEAVALATADADGHPRSATSSCGAWTTTASASTRTTTRPRPGTSTVNPYAALDLAWVEIGRQVRVGGPVQPTSGDDSDAYWATRPRPSQLAARASRQSRPVADRATMVEARGRGGRPLGGPGGAPPRRLGRLRARARALGVLERSSRPPPRPLRLRARRRRRLDDHPPLAVRAEAAAARPATRA